MRELGLNGTLMAAILLHSGELFQIFRVNCHSRETVILFQVFDEQSMADGDA